ncbi:MAG: hypothetical protein INQ03_02120 [Candidatus Heimdallarchaeota archaeon]|nr:hypothetical protein [Candidatus Heimdallarchaeota archaeon]
MSNFDTVIQTLRGNIVAEPLISLWRHYPESDLKLTTLLETHVEDLKRFPSDLIKLSPHARYATKDWGCEIKPGTSDHGSTGASSCSKCAVTSIDEWDMIQEIDVNDGHYGEQIKYVEKMRDHFPDHPIMMTVFSPTMVARKLSQNSMPSHLEINSSKLNEPLKIIEKTTIEFANACIDAGANGIFSAIQEVDRNLIKKKSLLDQMLKLNKPFMTKINQKAEFTVLHLHGEDVMFKEAVDYFNPTAVNWHDRVSFPSLMEAREIFKGGLLGGLDPDRVLEGGYEEDMAEIRYWYEKIPHILAPGCVLLQGTKEEYLDDIFSFYKSNR